MDTICAFIAENRINVYQFAVHTARGVRALRCQPCNDCNNIYSVSKVFVNTAVGMLADAGRLRLDDRLLPLVQRWVSSPYDAAWDAVTVAHALSHWMGVDTGVIDIDRDDIRTYGTDDHLRYILDCPPKFAPGSYRKYTDSAHYLLSLAVEQITGMPADDFIRREVETALDIPHTAWTRCPRNHTVGATGAYMRAEDMAKLGWLYANGGVYDGRRVVSAQWADTVERERFDFYPVKGTPFFCKGGMNGQMLLYSRELRVAAAWEGFADSQKTQALTDFVIEHLSGAARGTD